MKREKLVRGQTAETTSDQEAVVFNLQRCEDESVLPEDVPIDL